MFTNAVANSLSSIFGKLRYVEWLFLAVHMVMGISSGKNNLGLCLAFYGIFLVLSWILPLDRPLIVRQIYVLSAILLMVCANFVGVSLDLVLYLYIAKSFFLIGEIRTYLITAIAGIVWIISDCVSEIQELQELNQAVDFQPPFGFNSHNLSTIFIHSLGIYLAVSVFVISFSSVVCAEYKSRKRAEALAEQVETLAADLERTRIARDIHDSLGHTLTNLDIQLAVAQKLRDRNLQKAFQAIDTAKMLSSQCIEDVSHAVKTMRDSNFDLDRALKNLMEKIRSDQSVQIHWEINLPQLPIAISHQIYCVVKEGLINIQKHARASCIDFQSKFTAKEIILQLEDNGTGFDLTASTFGSGLKGMTERVQGLGGKLSISSLPNRGTKILVIIPR
ncbi:sensor histidine kinase [Pleurocapsa sp. PCC 7319]|uniref:sensor histidine kinase n=1 Tax=Pleurocapsa sp. PCC 7319 TaxID=118161 RepID=UPI0003749268|nr:sensor histidine kinase [Pleurocapsa sp. PCC 7319]